MRKRQFFFVSLFVLLAAQNSVADDFRVIPNASVRTEYNDNIFFSQNDAETDIITTGSAGIELRERTERLDAVLKGRLDALRYEDNDTLNDIEQFYDGSVRYQLNQFVRLSGKAHYSEDSRPDRDIEVTGYVLNPDVRRRQNYSGALDYQASEKLAFFSSYSYQDDQFEISDTDEFTGQNVMVGLSRSLELTKPTAFRLYGNYSHYDFYSSKVENYRLTVGYSRDVSEKINYVLDIGPRYTEGEEKGTGDTSHDDGVGGNFTLTYKEELTTFDVNLFHEISGSSGRNGATKRTGLVGNLKHRLGERSSARFRLAGYLNTADRNVAFGDDLDELTITVNPSLVYEIGRDFFLETAYSYSVIRDREDDHEKHRNMIFVKLKYQYPVVE